MKYTLKDLTNALEIIKIYEVNTFGTKQLRNEIELRERFHDIKVGDIVSTDNGDFLIVSIDVSYKENDFPKFGAIYDNQLQVIENTIEDVVFEILEDVGERDFKVIKK